MADSTRDLLVKIKGDTGDFEKSMQGVTQGSQNAGLSFGKLTGAVFAGQAIFNLTRDAMMKVSGVLKESFTQYEEAQTAQKELEHSVIDVTHATREQLKATNDLADALSQKGVLDDDTIRKGLAQLSTFGLTNDSVRKLGKSMADLTVNQFGVAASGDDAVQAANIMAKALNGNFGALEKMGIHLTDVQKELIKTGTETQRVNTINEVLAANLRTNQATALQTTAGKIAHLKVQYGNLQEAIGGLMASVGEKFVGMLSNWIDKMGGADGIMEKLGEMVKKVKPYFPELAGAVGVLTGALVIAALPSLALVASLGLVVAVGALVGAAVEALVKHFGGWHRVMKDLAPLQKDFIRFFKDVIYYGKEAAEKVAAFAKDMWDGFSKLPEPIKAVISPVTELATHFQDLYAGAHNINDVIKDTLKGFQDLWNWFTNLTPIIILGQFFSQVLWPILKNIAQVIWTDLKPALEHLWEAFVRLWNALNPALMDALKIIGIILAGAFLAAIVLVAGAVDIFVRVLSFLISAISDVIGWIANIIGWFGNFVGVVINTVKTIVTVFSNLPKAIGDVVGTVIDIIKGIYHAVLDAFKDVGKWLYQVGKDLIGGMVKGIKDTVKDVEDAAENVAKSAVNKVKGWLGIHSPSTVFADIGQNMGAGMVNGIKDTVSDVHSAVSDLAQPTISIAQQGTQQTAQNLATGVTQPAAAAQPQPAANINFTLNLGLYAGMPVEKRAIAEDLWRELVRSARAQGVILPSIGSVGIQ